MTAKEILLSVKEKFNNLMAPVPAPVAPVAAMAPVEYTLQDGVTKVAITDLNAGGVVNIKNADGTETAAMAGDITLQDGTIITVSENGVISAVVAPAPVAPPVAPAPQAAAFAGGIEERLAALEVMVKGLMQSCMSWDIAQKDKDAAIDVYTSGLSELKTEMAAQKEIAGNIIGLVEILVNEPSEPVDPAATTKKVLTNTGITKEDFTKSLFSKKVKL